MSSGTFAAPDHEYPSFLELKLTATDSEGVQSTASVLLNPQTVALTFQTQPPGLSVAMNAATLPTPFTRTVIVGSVNSVGAPSPQSAGVIQQAFQSWSDGGTQNHTITAPATPTTYTASFGQLPVAGRDLRRRRGQRRRRPDRRELPAESITLPPGPPGRLTGRVQGSTVQLSWTAPITGGAPSGYVLEAGLTPGAATFQVPLGLVTSLTVPGIGAGRYYARVRAANGVGPSPVSNEVTVTVGCVTRPRPPVLSAATNGALGLAGLDSTRTAATARPIA